jgi:hypothetical protein
MSEIKILNQVPPKCANSIKSERDYQESIWNKDTTSSIGLHSNEEFLVFMQDYLTEAFHIASRNAEPKASKDAAVIVRKVCAMALATAEKNKWTDLFLEHMDSLQVPTDLNIVGSLAIMQGAINEGFSSLVLNSHTKKELKFLITIIFMAGTTAMVNMDYCPLR